MPTLTASTARRSISLKGFLTTLVLLCVAPLFVLAVVLAVDRVREAERETALVADRIAKNLAATMDQHIGTRIGALQMLAGSPRADTVSTWPAFYEEAQRLRRNFGGNVIFAGLSGPMRFHTGRPFGATLPALPRPAGRVAADEAARTALPAAGDRFVGALTGEPLVALAAPGVRDGRVEFLVLRVAGAAEFAQPLQHATRPQGWAAMLLDSRGETIAQADAAASAPPDPRALRVHAALSQAPWSIVVEVPAAEIDQPIARAAISLTLAVAATAVVAIVGGLWASRRLALAVRSIGEPQAGTGRGPPIRELRDLRETIDRAWREREKAVNERVERERLHAADLARTAVDAQVREGQLRGIFDSATDAIITCDTTHRIVMANPAAARMFGTTVDALAGLPLAELLPPRFREKHEASMRAFAATGVTSRAMGRGSELVALRQDGREFPIDAGISHVRYDGHELFTVIVRDVTERRRADDERLRVHAELARSREDLRRLVAAQDRVAEDERKRIARELHDDLQQSLAAILIELGTAKEALVTDRLALDPLLQSIGMLAQSMLMSMRRIVEDLRPQMLEALGLPAALEALGASFERHARITCSVDIGADVEGLPCDDAQANCLYRVAQEALNNVAKHARANRVRIRLTREGESSLRLSIADDGIGLAQEDRQKRRSYGLLGMEERVRAAGGTLSIDSSPGAGTTVCVVLQRDRPQSQFAALA